jgi:transcription elongation factor Elf1
LSLQFPRSGRAGEISNGQDDSFFESAWVDESLVSWTRSSGVDFDAFEPDYRALARHTSPSENLGAASPGWSRADDALEPGIGLPSGVDPASDDDIFLMFCDPPSPPSLDLAYFTPQSLLPCSLPHVDEASRFSSEFSASHAPTASTPLSFDSSERAPSLYNPSSSPSTEFGHWSDETKLPQRAIKRLKPRFQCPQCDAAFLNVRSFQRHTSAHNMVCGMKGCTKSFSDEANRKRHIKEQHSGQSFPCLVCGTTFPRKNNLNRHMLTCRNGKRRMKDQGKCGRGVAGLCG